MKRLPTRHVHSLRTIAGELHRDGKGAILATVAAGWFLSIGVRFAYPSLLPLFRSEFGFGLSTAGLLVSALWVAYALGQFPGGILGDRVGEGTILVVSTAVSTGALLVVATAVNTAMLFAGTVAFGLATSLYGPTRYTIFTDIYDDRAGTAVGLSQAVGSVGNAVLPAVVTAIASYATWRAGYGVLLPAFVGITVSLWLWVPGQTSTNDASTSLGLGLIRRIYASIARDGIPVIVAIQVVLGFVSQGFLGFYPTYLVEVKEFSPTLAATLYSLYFAVGVFVQPLTGLVNDRAGPKATLASLAGLYFLALLSLQFAGAAVHIVAITAVLSLRNGTGVVTNTSIADALFDDIKGSGLGFLRTGWILVGATSPAVVGYLGDLGFLSEAFLMLTALAGVATALVLLAPSLPSGP